MPSPTERRAAYRLLLFWAQRETRRKLAEGKLLGLGAWVSQDAFRGLVVTRGRLKSRTWERLTGLPHLPVLVGQSRMAHLIARHEHCVDHLREVGAVLAATRRQVWLVDGRRIVKGIVKACMVC